MTLTPDPDEPEYRDTGDADDLPGPIDPYGPDDDTAEDDDSAGQGLPRVDE